MRCPVHQRFVLSLIEISPFQGFCVKTGSVKGCSDGKHEIIGSQVAQASGEGEGLVYLLPSFTRKSNHKKAVATDTNSLAKFNHSFDTPKINAFADYFVDDPLRTRLRREPKLPAT